MAENLLKAVCILPLVWTTVTCNSGFTRLGSLGNSVYFISDNALPWPQAQEACFLNLPPAGKLVCIETQEKLQLLWDLVSSSDDVYSSLWIGGRADESNQTFYWCDETKFQDWVPWGPGEPRHITSMSSVSTTAAGGFVFHANMRTVAKQFICELDLDETQPPTSSVPPTSEPTTESAAICTKQAQALVMLMAFLFSGIILG